MKRDLDHFFEHPAPWHAEARKLRAILFGAGLVEERKWDKPCYTFDGHNIAILQPMQPHLSLMFFKGALLEDPDGRLEPPGPNSQAARRLLFTGVRDVTRATPAVKRYLRQAIAVEEQGRKVDLATELELAPELAERLDRDPALKAAFEALTPGRQRGYNLYFADAKQSATRVRRIQKCSEKILRGKGLRD